MTDCKNLNVSIPVDATTLSEKFATAKREVRALRQELERTTAQARKSSVVPPDSGTTKAAAAMSPSDLAEELGTQEEAGRAYVEMLRDGHVDPDMQEKLAELEQHRRQQ